MNEPYSVEHSKEIIQKRLAIDSDASVFRSSSKESLTPYIHFEKNLEINPGIVFHLNHMAVHQGVVPKSMMEKKPLQHFIKTKRWYPEGLNFQIDKIQVNPKQYERIEIRRQQRAVVKQNRQAFAISQKIKENKKKKIKKIGKIRKIITKF